MMMKCSLMMVLCCAAVAYACVDDPPGICSHTDLGSCGNACCMLGFYFPSLTPKQFVESATDMLLKGGLDGRYILQVPAGGTTPGFSDLTPYNLTALYLGQAKHLTASHKYTDTVNIMVENSTPPGKAWVKIFSTSEIAGAYGDYGQNYANVVRLVLGLKTTYNQVALHGCGLTGSSIN